MPSQSKLARAGSLSRQLNEVLGLVRRNRSTHNEQFPSHVDIVSDGLCDDVLEYLGPSLEKHKGCDIIDIHPGACLWSRKLHDVLKPRRHLLMEPEKLYYEPFIKPLLDQKDSAWRHTEMSGAHPKSYWSSYDAVFKSKLLREREPLKADDPRLRQPNNTLLITGSFFRKYHERLWSNHVHNANLILNQMIHASQTNTLFHAYGLVRMLVWQPEYTRPAILPHTLYVRSALNFPMTMVASVTEVAGAGLVRDPNATLKKKVNKIRAPEIDDLVADRTLRRMEQNGIHAPEHRQNKTLRKALDRKAHPSSAIRGNVRRRANLSGTPQEQLEELNSRLEKHEKAVALHLEVAEQKRVPNGRVKAFSMKGFDIPYEYQFPSESMRGLKPQEMARVGPFLDRDKTQIDLELVYAELADTLTDHQKQDLKSRLLHTTSLIREAKMMENPDRMLRAIEPYHEELAVMYDPPLLPRDSRPYEPLQVEPADFWPRSCLYLLDVQPRERTFASDITSATEGNVVMRELAQTLFLKSSEGLPQALERVAFNAGKDLVAATPVICDPRRGGRLDPQDVIVRMMTVEMFEGLVTAFLEWPFRPSLSEMTASSEEPGEVSPLDQESGDEYD